MLGVTRLFFMELVVIINRCRRCEGRKTICALGGITKSCPECHGIGHVKAEEKVVETSSPDSKVVEVKVDKRSKEYRDARRKTDNLYA